ncbi:unnamed protein product [Cylicocyclus nassatus]|uniref:Uncharacterized protein n=1 Tax=Cylicocyclus nassatus TaxID=53992 RepID=A0AA36GVV7_CYLNA|nr:unnamed protein product [Cylicocyclus nassatus]
MVCHRLLFIACLCVILAIYSGAYCAPQKNRFLLINEEGPSFMKRSQSFYPEQPRLVLLRL